MKNTVQSTFFLIFAVIVFYTALTYTVNPITTIQKEFEYAPGTEDSVYIHEIAIPEEPLFSGPQIVGSLYKLNLDNFTVVVNNITFSTPRDIKEKLNSIPINLKYKQTIQFNTDGTISTITYTGQ